MIKIYCMKKLINNLKNFTAVVFSGTLDFLVMLLLSPPFSHSLLFLLFHLSLSIEPKALHTLDYNSVTGPSRQFKTCWKNESIHQQNQSISQAQPAKSMSAEENKIILVAFILEGNAFQMEQTKKIHCQKAQNSRNSS